MFWTSERVNWREEATGVGARKRLTVAILAAEGGTNTRAGIGAVNDAVETTAPCVLLVHRNYA